MRCPQCRGRSYYFKVITNPPIGLYKLQQIICDKCKEGKVSFQIWIKEIVRIMRRTKGE
jgi:hypothetical protein